MVYVGLELGKLLGVEYRVARGSGSRREAAAEVVKEAAENIALESEGKEGEVMLRPKEEEEEEEEEGKESQKGAAKEKEKQKEEKSQELQRWKRNFYINLAYAPMTIHYSLEGGFLSEGMIGALGVVVAWWSFGEAWRAASA